eukprot:scaffold318185_cov39-Tisochrysis_lutea.AAC.5
MSESAILLLLCAGVVCPHLGVSFQPAILEGANRGSKPPLSAAGRRTYERHPLAQPTTYCYSRGHGNYC